MTSGEEDPFDNYSNNAEVGVGASDTVLLAVSLVGFSIMAALIYSIIIARVKSSDDSDKRGGGGARIGEDGMEDYEEELLRADVSTLNRAQRRARAKALMKRQRRVTGPNDNHHQFDDDDGNHDNDDNNNQHHDDDDADDDHAQLSRKERQKAAKAAEKEARHLMDEERREEQRQAMLVAQEEKKQRLKEEAEKAREEKLKREQEDEQQRQQELEAWKTFLVSPKDGTKRISVEEWAAELQQKDQQPSVSLNDLASRFDVSVETVKARIRELVRAGRITGILEEDQGLFIALSHAQMLALATFIKEQGEVSLGDVSRQTIRLVKGASQ